MLAKLLPGSLMSVPVGVAGPSQHFLMMWPYLSVQAAVVLRECLMTIYGNMR